MIENHSFFTRFAWIENEVLIEAPAPYQEEDGINYIHTDALVYAAKVMDAVEGHDGIRCGWLSERAGRPCGEPATYLAADSDLAADSTRVGARGDIEGGLQWLCRKHLELIQDGPPEDQPVFGHITGE